MTDSHPDIPRRLLDATGSSHTIGSVNSAFCSPKSATDGSDDRMSSSPFNDQSTNDEQVEVLHYQAFEATRREHFAEAVRFYRQAADLVPDKEIWRWKSLGFCPAVFPDQQSVESYWQRLEAASEQAGRSRPTVDWKTVLFDGFTPSFNLPHLGKCCKRNKENLAGIFRHAFPHEKPALSQTLKHCPKIRVGFVAVDGHYRGFLRVHRYLLENIGPKEFDVLLFCTKKHLDSCKKTIHGDHVRIVPLPDSFEQAVEAIRETRCSVLYHWKVGGGLLDYFLPFARLAPIQCTSYGTHGTSGVEDVDYYLTSPYMESPSTDFNRHYTEKTYLFQDHVGYLDGYPKLPHVTRADFGLPENEIIYFCPHRLPKFGPVFDHYLKRILDRVPCSRLVILTKPNTLPDHVLRNRLRKQMGERLFQRIVFVPTLRPIDLQRLFSVCDVVLDSPMYSGSLTSYDAFHHGLPVVTQAGELAVQCYTSGLYRRMSLENFVIPDAEDGYVEQAVLLGKEQDYRMDIIRQINEKKELIFGNDQCVRDFEEFLQMVCANV